MSESGSNPPPSGAVVPVKKVRLTDQKEKIGIPINGAVRVEPAIEEIKENGIVRAINITCSCGERLRLVCEYEGN
jgi:hypothetical protein